jgi:hypothetical protein
LRNPIHYAPFDYTRVTLRASGAKCIGAQARTLVSSCRRFLEGRMCNVSISFPLF